MSGPSNQWLKDRLLGAHDLVLGDYGRAVAHLEAAIESSPRDQETTLWLGEAYLRMDQVDQAEAVLTRFDKQITGEHPIAQLLHGITQGRTDGMRTLYICRSIADDVQGTTPAMDLDPPEIDIDGIWRTIGRFAAYRGPTTLVNDSNTGQPRPPTAELNPRSRVKTTQHRIVFETMPEVQSDLGDLAQAYPTVPYYKTYSSELLLWKSKYKAELEAFVAEWSRSQTRWSYVGAASCLAMMGRDQESLEWMARGKATFGSFIPGEVTHAIQGEVFHRMGRTEAALRALQYAVEVGPGRLSAWISIALLYFDLGRDADAQKAAKHFISQAPDLVWEAHLSRQLKPALNPKPIHLRAILRASLKLMAGNRSSHLITYFDSKGRWRVHKIDVPTHTWMSVAKNQSDDFNRCAISTLFEGHFRALNQSQMDPHHDR